MTLNVEVFYSYQSPYSYLALEKIYQIQDRFNVELLWQPFSARAAGQPITPSGIIPDKLSYLFEDCKRIADESAIPLIFPESWPEVEPDPGRVTRGALVAADMDILMEYNFKVFNKWWGLGENPNEDSFWNELCDDLDIEVPEFMSRLASSDVRERVKGIYKRGKKLGVFDTPTFIVDKERFYGFDKIDYLKCRLEKLGLKK